MKKTKRIFAALAVLLALITLLSAAGCKAGNRFVGKWKGVADGKQIVLEFRQDGTASLDGEEVSYEIMSDNTLKIMRGFYYYECKYEFTGSKKLSITGDSAGYFLTGNYEKVKK